MWQNVWNDWKHAALPEYLYITIIKKKKEIFFFFSQLELYKS